VNKYFLTCTKSWWW